MIRTFKAAKTLCDMSGWRLSNLPLQKLLYLAHMVHLGEGRGPLIDAEFQAWDLGPVQPQLYRKLKAYGSKPVVDIFPVDAFPKVGPEYDTIKSVFEQLKDATPGRLVAITHQPHGAWASCFQPNMPSIVISDEEIVSEYRRRVAKASSS